MSSRLTPYQGRHRTFGKFHCKSCDHRWSSGNSWANMGQCCIFCYRMIYPYTQRPPKRPAYRGDKPHEEELCEMCITLGFNCRDLDDDLEDDLDDDLDDDLEDDLDDDS